MFKVISRYLSDTFAASCSPFAEFIFKFLNEEQQQFFALVMCLPFFAIQCGCKIFLCDSFPFGFYYYYFGFRFLLFAACCCWNKECGQKIFLVASPLHWDICIYSLRHLKRLRNVLRHSEYQLEGLQFYLFQLFELFSHVSDLALIYMKVNGFCIAFFFVE